MQNNTDIDLVPWAVVFSVLAAIMFCSSSLTTFFSSKSSKMKKAILADTEPLFVEDEDEWQPEESVERTLWMARETQRPVDYMYSASRLTR